MVRSDPGAIDGALSSNSFGATYRLMRDAGFSFRPEQAMRHKLWGIWVSDALYSILFVWVYAKGK